MKRNLEWRIGEALLSMVVAFICFSVLDKLINNNNEWLVPSIIKSISYGIGYFVGRTTVDLSESRWTMLKVDAALTLCVWSLLAFSLGCLGDSRYVVGFSEIIACLHKYL